MALVQDTRGTAPPAARCSRRAPADHSLPQTVELGDVDAPCIAVEPGGAEGVVLWTTPRDGTWMQPFELR